MFLVYLLQFRPHQRKFRDRFYNFAANTIAGVNLQLTSETSQFFGPNLLEFRLFGSKNGRVDHTAPNGRRGPETPPKVRSMVNYYLENDLPRN